MRNPPRVAWSPLLRMVQMRAYDDVPAALGGGGGTSSNGGLLLALSRSWGFSCYNWVLNKLHEIPMCITIRVRHSWQGNMNPVISGSQLT